MIKSLLSFQPLVLSLKKMIAEEKPGAKNLYGDLVNKLENIPEMMSPIDDEQTLKKHQEVIDTLCTTIFPPTDTKKETLYAVTYPFGFQAVYASTPFKKLFLKPGSDIIQIPGGKGTKNKISEASLQLAYNLILIKFYNSNVNDYTTFTFSLNGSKSVSKKLEAKLDARFIGVKKINPDFELPEKQIVFTSPLEELMEILPFDNFLFEGVLITDINDVTEREVISDIKNILININSFSDSKVYEELQQNIQALIGLNDIRIGITPFFKVSGYFLFSDVHVKNSLLFKNIKGNKKRESLSRYCQDLFSEKSQPIYLDASSLDEFKELKEIYLQQHLQSLIIFPLKSTNGLIGLLEIASNESGKLQPDHFPNVEPAIALFTLALEKSQENLEIEIDRKIKENFTAIQRVVEWKFTEAAFQYIQQKQFNENAKIPPIVFDEVFPLFGAIDIRNSSVERSRAIQMDLLSQLKKIKTIFSNVSEKDQFPLLKEILYKVDKYVEITPEKWSSEDEMIIHEFLQVEASSLITTLRKNMPQLEKEISQYLKELDPERNMIYNHRKIYEDSINQINDMLAHYIDEAQEAAQKVFPHYFERYVTDGVEFNIYIGQSLAPHYQFNEIYVRNLKMWQFELLAKAARKVKELESSLPLPMETTQLILVNSTPISISFRSKERKFDVDGSYNMRYEIMKKRIDKVHIKGTEDRLTQPGTIAIVYSQQKERDEYMEYIDFMRNEGLIGEQVDEFELEDLQGISGMHAIRVNILYGELRTEEEKRARNVMEVE